MPNRKHHHRIVDNFVQHAVDAKEGMPHVAADLTGGKGNLVPFWKILKRAKPLAKT
jgi:hypothetical protein